MDLTGKIIAILPASSGVSNRTGNSWMSQDYVIEVPGQYPRRMVFRIFGEDRIKQFNIQAGEEVTVQFDIDAHEYQGRWFNDIRAWKVDRNINVTPQPTPVGQPPFDPAQQPAQPATYILAHQCRLSSVVACLAYLPTVHVHILNTIILRIR